MFMSTIFSSQLKHCAEMLLYILGIFELLCLCYHSVFVHVLYFRHLYSLCSHCCCTSYIFECLWWVM